MSAGYGAVPPDFGPLAENLAEACHAWLAEHGSESSSPADWADALMHLNSAALAMQQHLLAEMEARGI